MIYIILVSIYIWFVIVGVQNCINRKKLINMILNNILEMSEIVKFEDKREFINNILEMPEIVKFEDKREIQYKWKFLQYDIFCTIKMNKSNDLSKIRKIGYFALKEGRLCLLDITIGENDSTRSELVKVLLLSSIVAFTNDQIKKGIRKITNNSDILGLQELVILEKVGREK